MPLMNRRVRSSSGRAVRVRRGSVAAVAVACAVLASGCGSSSGNTPTTKAEYLNIVRVEHAIEASILSQRHLKAQVRCPVKVAQKPGKFPCIASMISAKKPHKEIRTPFIVTIHNDKGYVTYVCE